MNDSARDVRPLPLQYTRRWRDAIELTERAHRGQQRKSADKPYFLHPFAVAQLLAAAGADDDLVIAGFSHDVPEDTSVTLTDIEDRFGSRVAFLVAGVTKQDVDEHGQKLSWREKGDRTVAAMRNAHSDIVVLKSADLAVNITDLLLDQEERGFQHWDELFHSHSRAVWKIGHYLELGDILHERLRREDLYPLLRVTLERRLEQLRRLHGAFAAA